MIVHLWQQLSEADRTRVAAPRRYADRVKLGRFKVSKRRSGAVPGTDSLRRWVPLKLPDHDLHSLFTFVFILFTHPTYYLRTRQTSWRNFKVLAPYAKPQWRRNDFAPRIVHEHVNTCEHGLACFFNCFPSFTYTLQHFQTFLTNHSAYRKLFMARFGILVIGVLASQRKYFHGGQLAKEDTSPHLTSTCMHACMHTYIHTHHFPTTLPVHTSVHTHCFTGTGCK